MEYYVGLANGDPVNGMREYLERYVYGPESWTEFLASDRPRAAADGRSRGEVH